MPHLVIQAYRKFEARFDAPPEVWSSGLRLLIPLGWAQSRPHLPLAITRTGRGKRVWGRADAPRPCLGPTPPVTIRDVGRDPGEMLLHQARRGDRRGERRELERRQKAADDGGLGDGGDASPGSRVTPGAALQVDVKNPFEQPCPANARGRWAGCRPDTLLTRGGGDRTASLARRGQTAALSHRVLIEGA
jgi:hypothetical protein